MRGYSLVFVLAFACAANIAGAQAWLQSGAMGGADSAYNYGASASIQTVYQNISMGSLGFWIGENLDNGAFVQIGYEIVNQSAYYPTYCDTGGCNGSAYIKAGVPTWFWEYFPASSNESNFYGGIGSNASAGTDGIFNTYSFRSSGNTWYFYFNGQSVGSVDLGTASSGRNSPSALAEITNTDTNAFVMKTVQFKDAAFYNGDRYVPLPSAYSNIGYGKDSIKTVTNTYGVQEVGRNINYFETGSGLSTLSGTLLWRMGYGLGVSSQYGNISGSGNYFAFAPVTLHAPGAINISGSVRELFVGWKGTGIGAYTGNASTITVTMESNITERAVWQRQYYIGVNSSYGGSYGAGWYNANGTATIGVSKTIIGVSDGVRLAFAGWSSGAKANSTRVVMDAPKNMTAHWSTQYLVNATTPYGNVTGNGWYMQNSTASISLSEEYVQAGNDSRIAFQQWSDGTANSSRTVLVDAPVTISALYAQQYLVTLLPENANGAPLEGVEYFNVSGMRMANGSAFLFANRKYNVAYIYYKGTVVTTNYIFEPAAPGDLQVRAPVYDVALSARSLFGTPVNATLSIAFRNGTSVLTSTGDDGTLVLHNVPYGYVAGTAKYFGLTEGMNLVDGAGATMTFITPFLVEVVLAGMVAVVLIWIGTKRLKARSAQAAV